jgi:hypothetical protein
MCGHTDYLNGIYVKLKFDIHRTGWLVLYEN